MAEPIGTALVRFSEFGPYDALSERAHEMYIGGFSEHAVHACRAWMIVTGGAGDRATTLFLRYIEGIALQELGQHHEAVTAALDLLRDVEEVPEPMWRAKGRQAGPHMVRSTERALRMGRLATLAGSSEMSARAQIIEAYALSRLGCADLAARMVNAATGGSRLRDELVETHLAHLVLGQAATESGGCGEARRQLLEARVQAGQ